MLKAKAVIKFTVHGKDYASDSIRPAFNFGNDMLHSGEIRSEATEYLHNESYTVDVYFFTIPDEAYGEINPLLFVGKEMTMQEGRRIIGTAKLLDFEWQ